MMLIEFLRTLFFSICNLIKYFSQTSSIYFALSVISFPSTILVFLYLLFLLIVREFVSILFLYSCYFFSFHCLFHCCLYPQLINSVFLHALLLIAFICFSMYLHLHDIRRYQSFTIASAIRQSIPISQPIFLITNDSLMLTKFLKRCLCRNVQEYVVL